MPDLVTLPDLAKITGTDRVTLWRWARAGKIPTTRTGHWYRFDLARLPDLPASPGPPSVSLPELAEITGIPARTLRRWAAAEKITTTRTPDGRHRFDLRRLDEIPKPRIRPKPSGLVSLARLAEITGHELATLQRWARSGRIRTTRVGDHLYFDVARLGAIAEPRASGAERGRTATIRPRSGTNGRARPARPSRGRTAPPEANV